MELFSSIKSVSFFLPTIIAAGQEVSSDELDDILDKDKETQAFTASVSFTHDSLGGEVFKIVCLRCTDLVSLKVPGGEVGTKQFPTAM